MADIVHTRATTVIPAVMTEDHFPACSAPRISQNLCKYHGSPKAEKCGGVQGDHEYKHARNKDIRSEREGEKSHKIVVAIAIAGS